MGEVLAQACVFRSQLFHGMRQKVELGSRDMGLLLHPYFLLEKGDLLIKLLVLFGQLVHLYALVRQRT